MNTRQSCRNKEEIKMSPNTDKDQSVDDILANVDQFIEGVYRDLSISPSGRSLIGNSTTANVSSSSTSSPVGSAPLQSQTPIIEKTPVSSPAIRRNMDAEIDRINRICENVDQNLRSIGLIMNGSSPTNISDNLSNINLRNSPSSSTSLIIVNSTSPAYSPQTNRNILQTNTQNRRSPSGEAAADLIVDLSNSQTDTPEMFARRVVPFNNSYNNDDDDVILVSADIPPVVDLCTPDGYQEISRPRRSIHHENLSRRRLHKNNAGDAEANLCCGGPSSRKKRYSQRSRGKFDNNSPETTSPSDDNDRRRFMCAVCMESCLLRQPTSTVCGHVFCKKCIEQAIEMTRKCPLCNKRISKKQILRLYF